MTPGGQFMHYSKLIFFLTIVETVPTETKVHFNKMMALTKMAFAIGQSLGHTMKVCLSLITVVKFNGETVKFNEFLHPNYNY